MAPTQTVDDRIITKLDELAERSADLERQLSEPEVASNPTRSIALTKELGRLRRVVDPYKEARKVRQQLDQARALVDDPAQDPEMKAMAREEAEALQQRYEQMLEDLKSKLVSSDDAAIESIILEIRAGTGGDEAALFARDLYEMYLRFCERKKFTVEVLDQNGSELGGLRDVVLNVKGPQVFRWLGYEGGGHRVQRVPETEAQGRIHTSAATVAVLPEPEEINIDVNWDRDVEEFVSRAGGPGGQNVNKVSSAIRLVHRETGITVSMRDEKSQHKNRAKARRVMLTRLFDHQRQSQDSQRDSARRTMIGSGDRSQRIRTYNFPQNRVTDHRINLDLHSLERIIAGDLEELVEALQNYDREQRLKAL